MNEKDRIIRDMLKVANADLSCVLGEDAELKEASAPWIGEFLDEKNRKLVSSTSQKLGFDILQAAAFCVELLQDVNAHKEAAAVNKLLIKAMGVKTS